MATDSRTHNESQERTKRPPPGSELLITAAMDIAQLRGHDVFFFLKFTNYFQNADKIQF